jgi:hypothetical protein
MLKLANRDGAFAPLAAQFVMTASGYDDVHRLRHAQQHRLQRRRPAV